MIVNLDRVRAALTLTDFDGIMAQGRMAPIPRSMRRSEKRNGNPRQASVLLLLFPGAEGLSFVLTRRSENEHDVHSGQISFPGGSREPGESNIQNALRETYEELGVAMQEIEILGSLSDLYIRPSDFEVHPLVGYVPYLPTWRPCPTEVAEALVCPVSWLLEEERHVVEDWDYNGFRMRVPWYNVRGHKVWGATAMMLSEFEQRLRCV